MNLARAFLTLGFGLQDIIGLVTSGIGAAKGAKDLIGNAGTKAYIPKGLGEADQTWQSALEQMFGGVSGAGAAITPELAAAFQKMLGLDTSGITQAGQAAGQQYANLAPQATAAGNYLTQQGMDVGNAGKQLWQTSLDPQNALRDQLQQQTVDASRAGSAARGLVMGGQSAGIEDKAVNDFLLNWQNQQLGRQATGLQGYANAAQQAGRGVVGGLGAGQMGADFTMQSGQVPFQANAQAAGWPMQASNMYTGALGGLNSQYGGILSSIIPYLNQGQGATQQGFAQGQTGLNNFTTGARDTGDWLANLFSQPSGYGYGTNYGFDNTSLGPPQYGGG